MTQEQRPDINDPYFRGISMKKWTANTLRYPKQLDDNLRDIHRIKTNYDKSPKLKEVTLAEEQFERFIPLFQKKTLEAIQTKEDAAYYSNLTEEFIDIVGRYKKFHVKFNDGKILTFSQNYILNNEIKPEDSSIIDVFAHYKNSDHPLYVNRADSDFHNAVLGAQDVKAITETIDESDKIQRKTALEIFKARLETITGKKLEDILNDKNKNEKTKEEQQQSTSKVNTSLLAFE